MKDERKDTNLWICQSLYLAALMIWLILVAQTTENSQFEKKAEKAVFPLHLRVQGELQVLSQFPEPFGTEREGSHGQPPVYGSYPEGL